jgi:hypothetical protein
LLPSKSITITGQIKNEVSDNKYNCQSKPTSEESFVVLPSHPFYGCRVRVISKQEAKTYTLCVIEDPRHAGFHYQLNQRWLAHDPPNNKPVPDKNEQKSISLPLPALDKMVQMILIKNRKGRDRKDDSSIGEGNGTDLGQTAEAEQNAVCQPSVLSGTETARRGCIYQLGDGRISIMREVR